MVGAVMGAGAGLSVKGGIDTSMIERGFERVRQSFEGVKGQAKSFTSDVMRMDLASSRLVKSMAAVGMVGVSAIAGLASKAPAVAGSIAKMSVEFDRLQRLLGTQFKSEFETASNMFTKFVNFVEAHPNLTKGLAFSATAAIGFAAAGKFLKVLGLATVSKTVLTALSSILKIAALPVAASAVAAGAGAGFGEWIGEKTYKAGGVSEDVARWITEHPTIQAGIEGYAGLGGAVYDFFKGLVGIDKEDNRRDQTIQSDDEV